MSWNRGLVARGDHLSTVSGKNRPREAVVPGPRPGQNKTFKSMEERLCKHSKY